MQEIQYTTTVKTHFNSFKIRSCFLIPFMFLIKQKITVWRSAVTREHFTRVKIDQVVRLWQADGSNIQ